MAVTWLLGCVGVHWSASGAPPRITAGRGCKGGMWGGHCAVVRPGAAQLLPPHPVMRHETCGGPGNLGSRWPGRPGIKGGLHCASRIPPVGMKIPGRGCRLGGFGTAPVRTAHSQSPWRCAYHTSPRPGRCSHPWALNLPPPRVRRQIAFPAPALPSFFPHPFYIFCIFYIFASWFSKL